MSGRHLRVDPKDLVPGLLFIATGAYFLINAIVFIGFSGNDVAGSATLPTLLAVILIIFGLTLAIRSIGAEGGGFRLLVWPKLLCILVSPVIFGLMVRPLGLVPALILSLVCAILADPATPIVRRAGIVAAITILCVVIFHYGLHLPFLLVRGWNLP